VSLQFIVNFIKPRTRKKEEGDQSIKRGGRVQKGETGAKRDAQRDSPKVMRKRNENQNNS